MKKIVLSFCSQQSLDVREGIKGLLSFMSTDEEFFEWKNIKRKMNSFDRFRPNNQEINGMKLFDMQRRCEHCIKKLNIQHHIPVPRSVVDRMAVQISLHGFSDASKKAHVLHFTFFKPTLLSKQARIYQPR